MLEVRIGDRLIGEGHPCFVIAEISANHNKSYEKAERLVRLAKECGADAVKLQTYTADTMTIDCDNESFQIKEGLWKGHTLYSLYQQAYTPWEWQPNLKSVADEIGIVLFSTPFDRSAVDFLEDMNVPAYKIASFENVDIPLIRYTASKGKPVILSTGLARESEIEDAVNAIRGENNEQIILLKCTSSYPAPAEQMNIRAIPWMKEKFGVVTGLSDHSLNRDAIIASVALGSSVLELHFTERRVDGGADAPFSIEPGEMTELLKGIRTVEKALGRKGLNPVLSEKNSLMFRRSIFAVRDIDAGMRIMDGDVRSIRPGYGLAPKCLNEIIGKRTKKAIPRGTPLDWDLLEEVKCE